MPDQEPSPPKSSTWKEFWKGVLPMFWKSVGFEETGKDFEAHGGAVRKGAILRALFIFAILGFGLKGYLDAGVDGSLKEAERDRDKYQTLYNQDENTIAPLRQLANSKFAEAPPDKRVDLEIKMLSDIDSKMGFINPINQPIAISFTIAKINIDKLNLGSPAHYPNDGALFVIGHDNNGLLITTCAEHVITESSTNGSTIIYNATTVSDSSYLGKPITSLLEANAITIQFPKTFIPEGTVINGGIVTWVINGNVTLKFNIPKQKAMSAADGRLTYIFITDLNEGFSPIAPK